MSNKQRLLELISKREEICSEPLNHGLLYQWLEELHYLFGQLNLSSTITPKIRLIIEQVFYFTDTKESLEEKVLQINAKLFVFEKYEVEQLK